MTVDYDGIVLVNLGSPESTSVSDVRRYLDEFLMDEYVIDVPYLLRYMIVKWGILPFRPKRSAEAYQSIWWDEGAPLIVLSRQLQEVFQQQVSCPVGLGMRYASPSIADGIQEVLDQQPQAKRLLMVPLYPHFAMASTKTVIEQTKQVVQSQFPDLELSYIESFYQYPLYVDALAHSIKTPVESHNSDYVLFSYHGIPERHVRKTDCTQSHCLQSEFCCETFSEAHQLCYRHQVKQTTKAVVKQLGFDTSFYGLSFQSRLGKDPWLQPFTDITIGELAQQGVKRLSVVCPAFVSDCLETLEEMGEEGQDIFLENGGESFQLIPCLNTQPKWVDALRELVCDKTMHLML